jgi:uncharacterized protein
MIRRELIDAGNVTARICADGCLVADVRAARTGLQDYLGQEVDPNNDHGLRDKDSVAVYRPENEVFSRDSMASFSAAPFTIDHPSKPVDAQNWRELGRGEVNGDVVRDGEFVRVPVIVRDADAVNRVNTTHKQLSMGYSCQLVFPQDGKHPDGTACDAYQTQIRINHIAAVKAARGGPLLKISDERTSLQTETGGGTMPHTLMIDGLQVPNVSDEAKACIEKLQNQVKDAGDKLAVAVTEAQTKDAKIATLEKAVEDAKITPAALRDAAKAYSAVCDKAKALGVTFADNADADTIMKAAVDAKMGDASKDWTADQIAASFAVLSADAKADPLRGVIADGSISINSGNVASLRDAARISAAN